MQRGASSSALQSSRVAAVADEPSRSGLASALKSLRKESGLTQAVLAEDAGVSTSFISQLERGSTDVTFSTLTRICAALGTTVGALFEAPRQSGRVLALESCKKLDYRGVDKYVMTRSDMEDVDVCQFEFPSGASTGLRNPPGTDRTELWICVSEFLAVEIEGAVNMLRAGDSIDFSSAQANTVYNPGPAASRALLVIKHHTSKRRRT